MSNTGPEPCTKLRADGRSSYFPILRHYSLTLTEASDRVGRTGTTICGLRDAIDQDRASSLARRRHLSNIKLHELQECRRCQNFLRP